MLQPIHPVGQWVNVNGSMSPQLYLFRMTTVQYNRASTLLLSSWWNSTSISWLAAGDRSAVLLSCCAAR
jgi:hypothetical protein